jgi:lysophospholipase L1-like esterase
MKWILLLLTVLTLSQLATAAALHRADALKVMVVGNSITHGYEADYTWRYRIWQWFKANDVPVEFVGPYQGTSPPDMAEPLNPAWMHDSPATSAFVEPKTNGRYAADVSPDFDSHHFSIWGFQVAQAKVLIREMAATYSPDIMLVELGFNDIGWFVNGPEGTLADMKAFIDNARSGKRDIKFAIANIPQRTFIGGRDDLPISTDKYNSMLGDACASWSTDQSPVKVVHLRETYDCKP